MNGKSKHLLFLAIAIGTFSLAGVLKPAFAAGHVQPENSLGRPLLATIEAAGPVTPTPTPTPKKAIDAISIATNPEITIELTEEGCCVRPMWSSDSEWVLYFDKPGEDDPVGLYGVPASGGEVSLFSLRVGLYSQDWSLVSYEDAGVTYVERWADGTRWKIPSEGRTVYLSPNGKHVVWEVGSRAISSPDTIQRKILTSTFDGQEPRELVTLHGGTFLGWIGDESVLVSGRLSPPGKAGLWRVYLSDGGALPLFDAVKPRSVLLSPDGEWVAVTIAFETDPDRNGLWVVRTNGRGTARIPVYGSYRWRSDGQLLVIPTATDEKEPSILQFDVMNDRVYRLTDPDVTTLPIANNDWNVSPDGEKIVFLSSVLGNLQVLSLPNP